MKKIDPTLPQILLPWYERNKRQLPWREDREPYHIWLSEIMLQQTRVEAVKGYYLRFLRELPTIADLARCDDDRLNKLWEGLGYYSRVRNLKKAAHAVIEQFDGRFPDQYERILRLPGIGEYTAGAICSICFDRPTPAVDGNVLRVIARLTDDATPIDLPAYKKEVREALAQVYPADAGAFTQALMELGATVCGPNRKPDCENCPCCGICLGYRNGSAEKLPVKTPKRQRTTEEKTVFILRCGDRYALTKRKETGLLAGLWQFPDVSGKMDVEQAVGTLEEKGLKVCEIYRQVEKKHVFTHIVWEMRGFYLEVRDCSGDYYWLTAEQIAADAALPTAYKQFWDEWQEHGV